MRASRGRSSETSLRLCSRAPRMISWSAMWCGDSRLGPGGGWSASCLTHPTDSSNRCSSAAQGVVHGWLFPMTDPTTRLAEVNRATSRYLQTLDGLTSEQLAAPSLLPGWTRAHVVAHLARHALGTTRALAWTGLRASGCPSTTARSRATPTSTRPPRSAPASCASCSFAACDRWKEAIGAVTDWDGADGAGARRPSFSADECIDMRWREVEIHHADLGCRLHRGRLAAGVHDVPPRLPRRRPHRGPHPPHAHRAS